jgi:hypothetical protein
MGPESEETSVGLGCSLGTFAHQINRLDCFWYHIASDQGEGRLGARACRWVFNNHRSLPPVSMIRSPSSTQKLT